MKWNGSKFYALLMAVPAALAAWGCGGSSANVITVTVSPSAVSVIAGQVQTFTATVSGTTTTTVSTWACTYSYLPANATSSTKPTTGSCSSGGSITGVTGQIGTWTITTTNGSNVLTYTAPSLTNFPVPAPTLTFAAEADANTKKTGTATVTLDSGIRVSVTPATATVPVGPTTPQITFFPNFINTDVSTAQFKLVQPNAGNTTNTNDQTANPMADTCSPNCGSIDGSGRYTPPATLPTDTLPSKSTSTSPTTVYVVVWSSKDPSRYAVSTITLVSPTSNNITFSGIYPPSIAAGGILQDVFLNAKNLLNSSQVFFIQPGVAATANDVAQALNGLQPLTNTTQVFTVPISSAYCMASASGVTPKVTCDASIMTRIRLLSAELGLAEPDPMHPAWVVIPGIPGSVTPTSGCLSVPNAPSGTTTIACPLHIVNTSPGLVAAIPDSIQQPASGSSSVNIGVNGGYYGTTGGLVNLFFDGAAVPTSQSGARQLFGSKAGFQLPSPGLYQVNVVSNVSVGNKPTFQSLASNIAVQPNFANFSPNPNGASTSACTDPVTNSSLVSHPAYNASLVFPACVLLNPPAGGVTNLAPSSITLDSVKGYGVITEQASNSLQLISLTPNGPVQTGGSYLLTNDSGTASSPTGFAIDDQLSVNGGDLGVVVSNGDSTLYLYSITPNGPAPFTYLHKTINVDLRTLTNQPTATGLPTPYAIGIDPGTHLGVVAYSTASTNGNIGFIVDVNPNLDGKDTHTCFVSGQVPPCVIAPVAIVTGPSPQVIMQPNAPLAYVTPGGGSGSTSVVNLLQTGTTVKILPAGSVSGSLNGATRAAGTATIHTATPHGISNVVGGTVIISGITTSVANSNFNGTYRIVPGSVIDAYTFSYSQVGQPDDPAPNGQGETNTSTSEGTVQYGTSYYSFNTSTTVSGATINPISQTFAYADYNNSFGQIGFISTLDQTLSSLTLSAGSCETCTPNPNGAPEIGFRSVAFDPFTDVLLAYNPTPDVGQNFPSNSVSFIDPGGSLAGGGVRGASRIIAAIPTEQIGQGSYTPSGASSPVPVYGPMAYDPITKYVIVASAGSNSMSYMSLDSSGNFQKAHVQSMALADVNQNGMPPFGVPIQQPALSTSAPSQAPTSCSLTDPTQPCMPQAVRGGAGAVDATLRIFGQGFSSGTPIVRLDGQTSITPPGSSSPALISTTAVSDTEVDVKIPAAALFAPHVYALDVQTGSNISNEIDLNVVALVDMSPACKTTSAFPQGPEGVAIDQPDRVALVTNFACNSVSVIAIDPNGYTTSTGTTVPFGSILATLTVGTNPIGVDVIPRLHYAVVANNGDTPNGSVSIIDITTPDNPQIVTWSVTSNSTTTTVNKATVGVGPLGVTIDQDRALALVANNGSNTLSAVDLTCLLPSDPTHSDGSNGHTQSAPSVTTIALSGPPTAVAVDPNGPTAVVTNLQNSGTTSATAGLDVVSLASAPPVKSSTASLSSLTASLTGLVFDPTLPYATNTTSSSVTGIFYATSTQQNAVYTFNPQTGSTNTIRVGINPYSLGLNYQTGTLLTINSTSNTSTVLDSQNFKAVQNLGITSQSQFAIGVDNLANNAVIADQNNNRVVILALPK